MADDIAVSVVMPCYNSDRFLETAIKSVFSQTYSNWELLIIDDCSSDNSCEIIQKYVKLDGRVKGLATEQNSGPGVARNVGISAAKGRYLAFLDADDIWHQQKLAAQLASMKKNNYEFTYSFYDVIDECGDVIGKRHNLPRAVSYSTLLPENVIGCLTAMIDTKQLGKVYMPPMRRRQDFALWLSVLSRVDQAHCVDQVLASYRKVERSVSSSLIRNLYWNYSLFRAYCGMSPLKSLYYLSLNVLRKIRS